MHVVAEELSKLPPVVIYEPEYVPKPPKVETSGEVTIEQEDGVWYVEGDWLEKLIENVNFGDIESRNWFDRQLRESGLFVRMEEMGVQDGDEVNMYGLEFEYQS
jgi:GTP-binding protein